MARLIDEEFFVNVGKFKILGRKLYCSHDRDKIYVIFIFEMANKNISRIFASSQLNR